MEYRKKPVVIEAIKWTGTLDLWMERDKNKLLIDAYENGDIVIPTDGTIHIKTLEGVMIASKGDYIIKGVKGEIYPCKPDIFEMTYDLVIDDEAMDDEELPTDSDLNTMVELELVMNVAIEDNMSVGLFIEMPGFEKPELITNPCENLPKKLEYYKATYDDNLEHKHAKGIKIIGFTF